MAALVVVLFGALIFVIIARGYVYAPEAKECTLVPSIGIVLNGQNLTFSAQKQMYVYFRNTGTHASGTYIVAAENSVPWEKETKGFCAEETMDRSAATFVHFRKAPIQEIAARLALPSADTHWGLRFGPSVGAWITPGPVTADPANPDHFRLTKPFEAVLNRQDMETTGRINAEYRIASSCAESIHAVGQKVCSVLVRQRSTNMEFLVWGIRIPDWPQENQPPPAAFIEFSEKIPGIMDLFETR